MPTAFPLVTCVMPTCNRRRYVPHAIDCFLRQDYPHLELLVVDDGADEVADLIPADPRVRYVRLPCRQQIGAKRNTGCDLAAGEIIVHWDDDDWSADDRVSEQVAAVIANGADLCGQSRILFYEPVAERAWEYVYPAEGRPWVHGATLCYTKAFWRRNPFPDIGVGEDTRFVWMGQPRKIVAINDRGFYVGTIHGTNTSPKQLGDRRWRACGVEEAQSVVGDRWSRTAAPWAGERDVDRWILAGGAKSMALPNVTPGDVITAANWNDLVSTLNKLEGRVADLEGGSSSGTLRITAVLPTGIVTAGDTIRISGSNFDFIRGAHSVFFGTTRATSFGNGSSDNLLIVQIPDQVSGATPSGASLNLTVGNLTSVATWPMTIKSKPVQVGGGVEFGFLNSSPAAPMVNNPIQYNFRLASLSNVDLPVLIAPDLQFPGAPALVVEVHDSDGQLKADHTIALPGGAVKLIGVKIPAVPNVADGTPFSLAVAATAPGAPAVTASVPPQSVGHAGEQPDTTITNLTFNRVLDGTASFAAAGAGDTVDGTISIPGLAAVTVTIALDATFANIPIGTTFNYVPSAAVVSGIGWSSVANPLVTPAKYIVSGPGEQQFPGFDITAPATGPAVIRFTLTREGAATNNRRSVTFRVKRT